jgi:hypothetical protein
MNRSCGYALLIFERMRFPPPFDQPLIACMNSNWQQASTRQDLLLCIHPSVQPHVSPSIMLYTIHGEESRTCTRTLCHPKLSTGTDPGARHHSSRPHKIFSPMFPPRSTRGVSKSPPCTVATLASDDPHLVGHSHYINTMHNITRVHYDQRVRNISS